MGLPKHLLALWDDAEASGARLVEVALERASGGLTQGRVGRALKTTSLAWSAGRRILTDKLFGAEASDGWGLSGLSAQSGRELAAQMLSTFSELRGLPMKLAQMVSYLDGVLPPESQKILATLQRDAPPMPWPVVERVLRSELGEKVERAFQHIEPLAFASASIGQVHRGVLSDGTQVAVKVQYPEIEHTIRADLKNARVLGMLKKALFFHARADLAAVMAELEERFLEECDYKKEAAYQAAYGDVFAQHRWVRVPKVFAELSGTRVLTSEYFEGLTFHEWLRGKPSEAERQRAGQLFYRFYIGSFYLNGLFNCDPHPGNYLFLQDGQIVFLDYGCTRRYPKERIKQWQRMCEAVIQDEPEEIHRAAVAIGFVADETPYDREGFRKLIRFLYQAHLTSSRYLFSPDMPKQTIREMVFENPNLFRLNMPADGVFLNRICFGLVSLLAEIAAPIDVSALTLAYFRGEDPAWESR